MRAHTPTARSSPRLCAPLRSHLLLQRFAKRFDLRPHFAQRIRRALRLAPGDLRRGARAALVRCGAVGRRRALQLRMEQRELALRHCLIGARVRRGDVCLDARELRMQRLELGGGRMCYRLGGAIVGARLDDRHALHMASDPSLHCSPPFLNPSAPLPPCALPSFPQFLRPPPASSVDGGLYGA